ncbi:hypothetical protein [Bradyrhizobium retamae]|uniref:hypothetical protein n=1 Tax=Bradyrhizobium retamae TaxID=1300035 RepID=UPI0012E3C21B|nr:hypothetical protein [Bradyrhizobium retamae]
MSIAEVNSCFERLVLGGKNKRIRAASVKRSVVPDVARERVVAIASIGTAFIVARTPLREVNPIEAASTVSQGHRFQRRCTDASRQRSCLRPQNGKLPIETPCAVISGAAFRAFPGNKDLF